MQVIVFLFKLVLLLVGGVLLLGGGACAVIDLAALGGGGTYAGAAFVALIISLAVALVGWLLLRFALKPPGERLADAEKRDGSEP